MPNAINFDQLVIDRVVDAWFESKSDNELIAVLDQVTNFSVNTSSETKDKTDAQGVLLKRYFLSKSVDISGENAVFSLNMAAIQAGTTKKMGTEVTLPRVMQIAKTDSPYELPDAPIDGTLLVYGTSENGIVDVSKKYTKGDSVGVDTYAVSTAGGVTTLSLPTNATDTVQIKYEYTVASGDIAARVDQTSDKFPAECKATFRVLCSDICDAETVRALYIVFPRFQMSPNVDLSFSTDSTQSFTATALKDYCGKGQLLYYIAIAEDSDEYDTTQFVG